MCLYILPTYSFERVYIFDSIFCLQVVSSVFTFSTRYFVEIRVSKNRNRARGKNENTWRHSVFESRGDKTYRCDLFKRNLFNAIYSTLVIIFTSAAEPPPSLNKDFTPAFAFLHPRFPPRRTSLHRFRVREPRLVASADFPGEKGGRER